MTRRFRTAELITSVILITSSSCLWPQPSLLFDAEALRKEGKCEQAIEKYKLYIDQRLKRGEIPPDQNPYFYYLLIGDCYLTMGNLKQAQSSYLFALDNGTERDLVAGKLRGIAIWHEERKDYEAAMKLLTEFRELDPLLYDLDIDRNHKKMLGDGSYAE